MKSAILKLMLLCCSLVSATTAISFGLSPTTSLRFAPLIGGPKFLPVHVQVIVYKDHVFDFVPLDATSPETLQKLISLQSVPAEIRYFDKRRTKPEASSHQSNDEKGDSAIDTVTIIQQDFCNVYDTQLNLLSNNCWKFAFQLVRFIEQREVGRS
jgi:hypothetical protein